MISAAPSASTWRRVPLRLDAAARWSSGSGRSSEGVGRISFTETVDAVVKPDSEVISEYTDLVMINE